MEGNELTLKMRKMYAKAVYKDPGTTLDDLREAVTTLEDTERIARRVLGGTHPSPSSIDEALRSGAKSGSAPASAIAARECAWARF